MKNSILYIILMTTDEYLYAQVEDKPFPYVNPINSVQ